MLKISNVNVYDLENSVIASGNAMRLEPVEYTEEEFQKGLKRMVRLVNASKNGNVHCHDNALVGIRVSFDVTYPQYWTPEFQRYHFADIVTSSSKMHRLTKMDFRKACNEYVSEQTIQQMEALVFEYNSIANEENDSDWEFNSEKRETHNDRLYIAFMKLLSNCPLGLQLFMRVSTNYKQLQTIYYQRKNHRLREDWSEFCKFIEELPYFKELILGETTD